VLIRLIMAKFDSPQRRAQVAAMRRPAFRFAPSPNGPLHLGHAHSALLNAKLAKEAGGLFLVRIEDIDRARCTAALAAQALDDLAWLGLRWEEPVRFQSAHLADYRAALGALKAQGLLYPCRCSRGDIAAAATGARDSEGQPLYPGTCKGKPAGDGPVAWRIDMAKAGGPVEWGDVILARRDIGVSYHIAVVVDDALQGITDVVRGRDLESATPIHLLLQRLLALPHPRYRHHDLILDSEGRKLSKSEGARPLRRLRDEGLTPKAVRTLAGFA
jgi:glutamyl-Q tRNA(Asp) synthetase